MLKCVVSVFDSAVQAYSNPFVVPARGLAVRSFTDEVNRVAQDNPMHNHSEDFELRLLAMFDEVTGIYHAPADGVIECLARGKDVKINKEA